MFRGTYTYAWVAWITQGSRDELLQHIHELLEAVWNLVYKDFWPGSRVCPFVTSHLHRQNHIVLAKLAFTALRE